MKYKYGFQSFPHLLLYCCHINCPDKIISTGTQLKAKVDYILILISEPPNLTICTDADIRPEGIFAFYIVKCMKMIYVNIVCVCLILFVLPCVSVLGMKTSHIFFNIKVILYSCLCLSRRQYILVCLKSDAW